ncbi:MAG: hypothetical protein GKR97_09795 [Rhizobiaceae bacterium]|nr:hypothetical protein [Rhizobiaceae bacterium]
MLVENIIDETAPAKSGAQAKSNKLPAKNAIKLILSAMENNDSNDDWYPLSTLGGSIMAANSDFDTRIYGYKKLSEFVGSLSRFELRKIDSILSVRQVSQQN